MFGENIIWVHGQLNYEGRGGAVDGGKMDKWVTKVFYTWKGVHAHCFMYSIDSARYLGVKFKSESLG